MIYKSAASINPFFIPEFAFPNNWAYGNNEANAKTQIDPRLVAGERTGVFIVAGQSNAASYVNALYTVTHPTKVQNLNIYTGGMYLFSDPALGCNRNSSVSVGSWMGQVGDKLIDANVFDRVIFIPVAIGATSIAQWVPPTSAIASGPNLHARLLTAGRRAAALGLTVSGFLWQQGEGDIAMSQTTYATGLNDMISAVRADGNMAPWFIGVSTYNAGNTGPGVVAACNAAPNGTTIFAGANTDNLTGTTYRQTDDTHFNANGAATAATRWATAIDAVY